ncbi:MAG: transglycosylase SLT domain-containing protein [Myxococcota bacterium]
MRRIVAMLLFGWLLTGCALLRPEAPSPASAAAFPVTGVEHRISVPWLPMRVRRFAPLLETASQRHGVDANLLAIVVLVESGGDPNARSGAGATGLMQLMPETAAEIAARRGVPDHQDWRLLDPGYNVDLGADYLAQQVRRFWTGMSDPTVARAAGAYNGGPGRMKRHLDQGAPLPAETQRYQEWVVGMWRERHQPRSSTFASWVGAGGEQRLALFGDETRERSILDQPLATVR